MIPGLGRSPGGGHGNLLQYFCLENPHGQKSLVGYSPWDRKEADITERLSTQYYLHPPSTSSATHKHTLTLTHAHYLREQVRRAAYPWKISTPHSELIWCSKLQLQYRQASKYLHTHIQADVCVHMPTSLYTHADTHGVCVHPQVHTFILEHMDTQ